MLYLYLASDIMLSHSLGKLKKKGGVEILYWVQSEFVQFSVFKLIYEVCSILVYLDKKSTTQFWYAASDTLGW